MAIGRLSSPELMESEEKRLALGRFTLLHRDDIADHFRRDIRPEALAALLSDLASCRVGYWHVPSRAHLLGHGDAPWLDALARRLAGMSLDDVAAGQPGALPGLGGMDFKVAAALAAPSLPVALDLAPLADPGLLRFAREHLRQVGFRA